VRHDRAVEAMTVPGLDAPRYSALHVVENQLQLSTVRQRALAMGRAHGLDAGAVERLGIVVAELAANIARHARTGQIILRTVGDHATGCIEVLALDKGPGIADMTRAMRGYGSPPSAVPRDGGFAGIRRLADLFDIYSQPDRGTAVVAHVGTQSKDALAGRCADSVMHGSVGVVCVPVRGEDECGDDWAVYVEPGRVVALLVDGLGHGPGAAAAAAAATAAFREVSPDAPEIVLGAMHTALRRTRGAALSVTAIEQSRPAARFCGVGNVYGRVVSVDASRPMMPQSGIVGHTMPRAQTVEVAWPAGARLVMHSDGISSRWRADSYPGLLARHPALLAGVLFRDFARARDDATVLVFRDPHVTLSQ
jgi:anti-sigma regulatory factor (Ser/Thr protein kinase)